MQVKCNVLDRQYKMYEQEYNEAALRVLRSGWYVLGNEVSEFESEFAKHMNASNCVGLNSGLDALILAVRALNIGKGDEVIVQANTYIATVLGITANGATPIYVEPDGYFNIDADKIEEKITKKTKAIIVVHLYGQASRMDKIMGLANRYNIPVIEDCAQSHESCFNGQKTGTFGTIGCFSFYPTKNMGAFGDAGCIITEDKNIADKIRMMRNYGSKVKYQNDIDGVNSRLDEIILPETLKNVNHVYHQFVIRCDKRDELHDYLEQNGIQTQIHYPIPPHLAKCYQSQGYKIGSFPITEKYANTVLSLPMYTGMTDEEQEYVINVINKF